jgi:AraC family transcriptional regulator
MNLEAIQVELHQPFVGLAVYPPGATFGPRILSDYELVWIVDGDVAWQADGIVHAAPPGTILLARPGMRESYRWDPVRQTRHAYIHFGLNAPRGVLPQEDAWPLTRRLPDGDILRPMFRHVAWLLEHAGDDGAALVESALRHLVVGFVLGRFETKSVGAAGLPAAVLRALRFVAERWAKTTAPPTLTELARAASVSPGHLARLFHASVGVSPLSALRLLRLERAAAMLARSNLSIKEVAASSGFESPFHFSRRFKDVYGVSPRTFRERLESGAPLPHRRLVIARAMVAAAWGDF